MMEPTWKEYIGSTEIESVWLKDKSFIVHELEHDFGMKNPPEWYVRSYWENQITQAWHEGWGLRYAYERTGRFASPDMTVWAVRECSKVHLTDCLNKSYAFCDLKDREYIGFCINCHHPIIACDSEEYCARCYRDVLNKWRPI